MLLDNTRAFAVSIDANPQEILYEFDRKTRGERRIRGREICGRVGSYSGDALC